MHFFTGYFDMCNIVLGNVLAFFELLNNIKET